MRKLVPFVDGVQVRSACASPAPAIRQNLCAAAPAAALAVGPVPGPLGAGTRMRPDAPAAMPPAITAGPPVKIAARHIPASARSHDPRRRRLVILGNLSSSIFQPPGTSFIN